MNNRQKKAIRRVKAYNKAKNTRHKRNVFRRKKVKRFDVNDVVALPEHMRSVVLTKQAASHSRPLPPHYRAMERLTPTYVAKNTAQRRIENG